MSADAMRDFGQLIGGMVRAQSNTAENLNANDPGDTFTVAVTSNAVLAGTIVAVAKTLSTSAFLLSGTAFTHPQSIPDGTYKMVDVSAGAGHQGSATELYRKVY